MQKIGLTGNIGSGKSTVASVFSARGIPVYHADDRSGNFLLLTDIQEKVIRMFGRKILGDSGLIDNKLLAGIVFGDQAELKKLTDLLHPMVMQDFRLFFSGMLNVPYVIMEAAILFESGYATEFNRIILVSCPQEIAIQRVIKREKIAPESVLSRMRFQMKNEELEEKADFIILNDGKQMIIPQVISIHRRLMQEGQ